MKLKCPCCGSENIVSSGYESRNNKLRRKFQCKSCFSYFYNSSKVCQDCFIALPKGRRSNYCEECIEKRKVTWREKHKKEKKIYDKKYHKNHRDRLNEYQRKFHKKQEKQIFCEMTGISRDRYLELKEFMGIK